MSSLYPKITSKKSPQLARYYAMMGLAALACIFLVLAFLCPDCRVPFTIGFAIAATGSIIFHSILNHTLKGYYRGPMFTRKAIDAQWEDAQNTTRKKN